MSLVVHLSWSYDVGRFDWEWEQSVVSRPSSNRTGWYEIPSILIILQLTFSLFLIPSLSLSIYIYIYICVCVCVCVCMNKYEVYLKSYGSNVTNNFLKILYNKLRRFPSLMSNVLSHPFVLRYYVLLKGFFWGDHQRLRYPIYPNPSARAGYDTRSIFRRSLTGLNSEFSFS